MPQLDGVIIGRQSCSIDIECYKQLHSSSHGYYNFVPRLLSLDVSSLEDVYWLEDKTARHVLQPSDFGTWSAARQSLPTGKEQLTQLKQDLWSAVVKSSKHQDAWTWGKALIHKRFTDMN